MVQGSVFLLLFTPRRFLCKYDPAESAMVGYLRARWGTLTPFHELSHLFERENWSLAGRAMTIRIASACSLVLFVTFRPVYCSENTFTGVLEMVHVWKEP